MKFYPFDLDLVSITMVLKLVNIYVCTENEVPSFKNCSLNRYTERYTDAQTDWTEIITYLHTWMVKICSANRISSRDKMFPVVCPL